MASYFNYIEGPQEKRGGGAFIDGVESRKFWRFIKENGLIDLGLVGSQFT